jgi:hypothetical protein
MWSKGYRVALALVVGVFSACGPVDEAGRLPVARQGIEMCPMQVAALDGEALYDSHCDVCGDGLCSLSESSWCREDCGPICGDGMCDWSETVSSCAMDCRRCGDGICTASWETTTNCAQDCGSRCGDGVCNGTEHASVCGTDCELPVVLPVDKVQYCRSGLFCNDTVSYPEYQVWEDNGVADEKQKKTFLSRASNPPRSSVERLVFIAAGQQNGWDDDVSTLLTGQSSSWNTFDKTDKTKWITTRSDALAHSVFRWTRWQLSNTSVNLAFDARFNFDFGAGEKQDIEDAYYQWLRNKFDSGRIRSIYLAGYSRGGCLVARLASRFNRDLPNVPLIVHIFDGVCAPSTPTHPWDGPEWGLMGGSRIYNPLNSNYSAYRVDMFQRFPHRARLSVLNMVGGEQVLVDSARALTHEDATAQTRELFENGRRWYRQTWHNLDHVTMDNWERVNDALWHLDASCRDLGC